MLRNTLLVLTFPIFKLFVHGFNVDVNFPIIYKAPSANKFVRNSYFGYSVLLNDSWITIGAPRANYSTLKLKEPGVVYRCGIKENCKEILLPEAEKASKTAQMSEYFDNAWFGVAMDQSPLGQAVVCGHRWRTSSVIPEGPRLPGACYWFQDEKDVNFIRPIPGNNIKDVIHREKKRLYYKTSMSESGISVHILPSGTKTEGIFFGSPGYFNWKGTVVHHEKIQRDKAAQKPAKGLDSHGFGVDIANHGYLGYHVSSGCFKSENNCLLVVGAPREQNKARHRTGSVILFELPGNNTIFWTYFHSNFPHGYQLPNDYEKPYKLTKQIHGSQEGEYFGSSFAAADFTGDGLDDLIVGAPFYSLQGDEGRIYVFIGDQKDILKSVSNMTGRIAGGRFGTSVASVGDLDQDGFQDIAVGAPYEGNGAIYIFYGNREGSVSSPRRITAEELSMEIKGFGISFSGMADVDGNKYKDIAVGAFLSGHAVILRSRQVVTLSTSITPSVEMLQTEKTLTVEMCLSYKGIPPELKVIRTISADESYKRVSPHYEERPRTLKKGQDDCERINFTIKDFENTLDPLKIKLSQELQSDRVVKGLIYTKTDADGFVKQGPVERKTPHSETEKLIPFTTKCGNRTCTVNLTLNCFLSRDRKHFNETFIIGQYDYLQLQVNATNIADPIYSSIMKVQIPAGIEVEKTSSSCKDDMDNILHCKLFAIRNKESKEITIGLDMTDLPFDPQGQEDIVSVQIDVTTNSTADGTTRVETLCRVPLNITVEAHIHAHGKPQRDNYPLLGSEAKLNVTHIYELYRTGYSPIREFEIEFYFPAKILSSGGSTKILSSYPQVVAADGGYNIHCDNDREIESNVPDENLDIPEDDSGILEEDSEISEKDSEIPEKNSGISEETRVKRSVNIASNNSNAYIPPANQTLYLNCNEETVECAKVVCQGSDLQSKTLELKLELNITELRPFMDQKNIIFLSTEAHIRILKPRINKRLDPVVASSPIIGQVQEISSTWIYVVSGVGGLLLVMLMVIGLSKAGFFQRTKKAELEALMQKEAETDTLEANSETMTRDDDDDDDDE